LIEEIGQVEKGIRLLGVTVTNFQAWVLWEWERTQLQKSLLSISLPSKGLPDSWSEF
jgi:hypothetical protein